VSARALTDFNLARQNRDDAICADVKSLRQVRGPVLRRALGEQARNGDGQDHARTENLDKLASADFEMIERPS